MNFATQENTASPEGAALAVFRHWLLEFLAYDQITGAFTWKTSPAKRFHIGIKAGSVNDPK